MEMAYIKVYLDFLAIAQELDNEQRGRLFLAILQYANGAEPSELIGAEKIAFLTIKGQIDRDRSSYSDFIEKQRENGRQGGRPRKSTAAENPLVFSKTQKSQDKDKDKDQDEDKDQDVVRRGGVQTAAPSRYQLPLNDGTSHGIGDADIEKYRALYPAVDVEQQLRSMIGWLDANPSRRKTRTGIRRFINSWLAKEQNSGRRAPTPTASTDDLYDTHENWGTWTDDAK